MCFTNCTVTIYVFYCIIYCIYLYASFMLTVSSIRKPRGQLDGSDALVYFKLTEI